MSDFNDPLSKLSRRFRPAEMMLLAGSAMGRELDPAGFADQVREDIASGNVFAMMIRDYSINPASVLSKLKQTSDDNLMDVLLARLDDWQRLPYDESMARNGLPSISTLQRLGLIPVGAAAWGWFCFRDPLATYEYALDYPQRLPAAESRTVDELAAELVRRVEASRSPLDDDKVLDCIYRILHITGWRRGLLVADDSGVRVREITVKELLLGCYEGELKGVALAGVNAPDCI